MLMTSGCWLLYAYDNFQMLAAEIRNWWFLLDVGVLRLFQKKENVGDETVKIVTNILKLSPTHFVSNIRQQLQSSHLGPLFNETE